MAVQPLPVDKLVNHRLKLERVFDAPRPLVFRAWTDPAQLAQWWGPHQYTAPACEVDLRVGGRFYVLMRGPEGSEHPVEAVFEAVTPPELLVFRGVVDIPPDVHFTVRNRVTFAEWQGKTRLTLEAEVLQATPASAFALGGMEMGWTQSLERLLNLLAKPA